MRKLPMIEVATSLLKDEALADCYVIGVQHILPTTLLMLESLFRKGLKRENVALIGKCYSTDLETYEAMLKAGIDVCESSVRFDYRLPFDESFRKNICKFLFGRQHFLKSSEFKKVIVLDDGGELLDVLSDYVEDVEHIVGIEQTSSGYNRLLSKDHKIPIINLARSSVKLAQEPQKIIHKSINEINAYIYRNNLFIGKVLIVGNGAIGSQMHEELKDMYDVSCYDIDPSRSDFAMSEFNERLGEFDLIIGCTGNMSISAEQHTLLKKGCILASLSSSDREFDAVALRKRASSIVSCVDHVVIGDTHLLSCGFPVSFRGDNVDDPYFFQFVRALIISSICQSLSPEKRTGFVDLKAFFQRFVMRSFRKVYAA